MNSQNKDNFFEGKDFEGGVFKALMPEYYPSKYKKYIEEETILLREKLKGSERILEAGVGNGRLISELAPIVGEMIGVDNADLMLEESRKRGYKFNNVIIKKEDLENLSKIYPTGYFTNSICIWNTLGNVNDDVEVLREISKVTSGSIFVTVFLKGNYNERINFYKTMGIKLSKIDKMNETFFSESGLKSKSYSKVDIKIIAGNIGLKILDTKVLGGVVLYAEFRLDSLKRI